MPPAGHADTVSEWLRRWTRNPLGFARRGSNPLGVVFAISRCSVSNVGVSSLTGRAALLAQWLERAAVNRKVTGSIPVRSVLILHGIGGQFSSHSDGPS
jgi:hypothetical protein